MVPSNMIETRLGYVEIYIKYCIKTLSGNIALCCGTLGHNTYNRFNVTAASICGELIMSFHFFLQKWCLSNIWNSQHNVLSR